MRRGAARLAGYAALGLAVALLVFFAASELAIRQTHRVDPVTVAVPKDAASVAEGARLATLVGCRSCHGEGKGAVWTPVDPMVGQIAPPPIARSIAGYSDGELARLIRHGVRKNGAAVFVMPTVSMRWLADEDVGRLIAWARSLRPAADDSTGRMWFGPVMRWEVLTGALRPGFEGGTVAEARRPAGSGRYFVDALCTECHDLREPRAHDGKPVPPLADAAAAYSLADFRRLLREGVGAGGRDVGFMGVIAKENLHALSDAEIAAVHGYLQGEAGRP